MYKQFTAVVMIKDNHLIYLRSTIGDIMQSVRGFLYYVLIVIVVSYLYNLRVLITKYIICLYVYLFTKLIRDDPNYIIYLIFTL